MGYTRDMRVVQGRLTVRGSMRRVMEGVVCLCQSNDRLSSNNINGLSLSGGVQDEAIWGRHYMSKAVVLSNMEKWGAMDNKGECTWTERLKEWVSWMEGDKGIDRRDREGECVCVCVTTEASQSVSTDSNTDIKATLAFALLLPPSMTGIGWWLSSIVYIFCHTQRASLRSFAAFNPKGPRISQGIWTHPTLYFYNSNPIVLGSIRALECRALSLWTHRQPCLLPPCGPPTTTRYHDALLSEDIRARWKKSFLCYIFFSFATEVFNE